MEKVMFNQPARLLLKFQKSQVLNESSSNDSDEVDKMFLQKLVGSNPFSKLGAFIKVKKILNQY